MLEQHLQWGHVKRGVHRLEVKVIFAIRQERVYKFCILRFQTSAHFFFDSPIAEVIVPHTKLECWPQALAISTFSARLAWTAHL
jgi:hypothetical protein